MTARQIRWLQRQIDKAKSGRVSWMSRIMQEVIPFNRPHRLRIHSISVDACEVILPWRRRNLNHVGIMHACALATAAEYASGLCVLSAIGVENVRLIMSELNIEYRRRAESTCVARAEFPSASLEEIVSELTEKGRCSFVLRSEVRDGDSEVVAKAEITWHLKSLDA